MTPLSGRRMLNWSERTGVNCELLSSRLIWIAIWAWFWIEIRRNGSSGKQRRCRKFSFKASDANRKTAQPIWLVVPYIVFSAFESYIILLAKETDKPVEICQSLEHPHDPNIRPGPTQSREFRLVESGFSIRRSDPVEVEKVYWCPVGHGFYPFPMRSSSSHTIKSVKFVTLDVHKNAADLGILRDAGSAQQGKSCYFWVCHWRGDRYLVRIELVSKLIHQNKWFCAKKQWTIFFGSACVAETSMQRCRNQIAHWTTPNYLDGQVQL